MLVSYIKDLVDVVTGLDLEKIEKIVDLVKNAKSIYVVGNGGSWSIAEHFTVDLVKLCGKKAYSISGAMFSMSVNDYEVEHSFNYWCEKNISKGDIVIGFTTSGKSRNIIRACVVAEGVDFILISGKLGGGDLSKFVSESLIIDSIDTQIIEDVFSIVCHLIARKLRESK